MYPLEWLWLAIAAGLIVAVGGWIFLQSMRRLSRDNAGLRLPYWAIASRNSIQSVLGRVAGLLLILTGAMALPRAIGWLAILVFLAGSLPGLLVIPWHNRRLRRRTAAR